MSHIDLEAHREQFRQCMEQYKARIVICGGTGCMANGAGEIMEEFNRILKEKGLTATVAMTKGCADYYIAKSGCQGFCQMGPLVTIYPEEDLYVNVKKEDVREIVDDAIDHAERKTPKHFMDVLLSRRYDDNDMIILHEGDFI